MTEYAKRGYLLENFRLFHLHTPQGTKVDYHYHEFYKILFFRSGAGDYVVEGQRYRLQPGDAVLIGSRSVHRPELDREVPYERIIIYIDPGFLARESDEGCHLAELFSGRQGHVLRLREPARKKLFALAAELEKELAGNGFGRTVLSNAALLRLLAQTGRYLEQSEFQAPDPVAPGNSRVLELVQYMDSHLSEDLNIDALAEQFYISKYHMMRLFRQETGYTIHAYLSHRRLLHARELIGTGMRAARASPVEKEGKL